MPLLFVSNKCIICSTYLELYWTATNAQYVEWFVWDNVNRFKIVNIRNALTLEQIQNTLAWTFIYIQFQQQSYDSHIRTLIQMFLCLSCNLHLTLFSPIMLSLSSNMFSGAIYLCRSWTNNINVWRVWFVNSNSDRTFLLLPLSFCLSHTLHICLSHVFVICHGILLGCTLKTFMIREKIFISILMRWICCYKLSLENTNKIFLSDE